MLVEPRPLLPDIAGIAVETLPLARLLVSVVGLALEIGLLFLEVKPGAMVVLAGVAVIKPATSLVPGFLGRALVVDFLQVPLRVRVVAAQAVLEATQQTA